MLENIILVNLAICLIFATILVNRKYGLSNLVGNESKSLGVAFLLLTAFTINMIPLVSAADDDGDGVIDKLDTKPLEYGQVPVYSEDKEISNSVSTNEGTITIDIQDIMILLAISSMLTLGFLWRAKRVQSEEKFEKKEVEL